MSMATYSSHTLPVRGRGSSGVGSAGLMEKIHEMLTERECSIFDEGLAAYHKRKDVNRFVESLSLVLNTNSKRQLLVTIRNTFIKPSDLIKFNDLCIKYGLALPLKGNTTKNAKKMFNKTQTGPKVYELKRDDKGEWGFSIRGGIDHGIGIFVSWVDRGSNAEKAGLKIGDYIHRVNEVGLEGLTFAQATQVTSMQQQSLSLLSYCRYLETGARYVWSSRLMGEYLAFSLQTNPIDGLIVMGNQFHLQQKLNHWV